MTHGEHQLKDGRTLVIRDAAPDDAAWILEYIHAMCGESDFLTFGPGEFEMTVEQEQEFLRRAAESDISLYLLGIVDGELLGTIHCGGRDRPRIRHVGEFGMSVRKSAWGLGIGGHLMDAMIEWARAGGIVTKINLKVRVDNPRAIALYERKGFVHEGTMSREISIGGDYFDQHCMGLQL